MLTPTYLSMVQRERLRQQAKRTSPKQIGPHAVFFHSKGFLYAPSRT